MWLVLLIGCLDEEFGVGSGTVYVKNDDAAPVDVLITDAPNCFAGTRSTIPPQTVRMFSVAEEAYVCVNGGATKVADGQRYVVSGGGLRPE